MSTPSEAPTTSPFLARLRVRLSRLTASSPSLRSAVPLVPHRPSPALARFGARLAGAPERPGAEGVHETLAVRTVEGCAAQGHRSLDSATARDIVPALFNYYMRDPAYLMNLPEAEEQTYLEAYRVLNSEARQSLEQAAPDDDMQPYLAFIERVQHLGCTSPNLALRTLSRALASIDGLTPDQARIMQSETTRYPRRPAERPSIRKDA